ncbi:RNA-binding region-containing protein 3-like isoform X2 [Bacillus rossius redtenbacheri]|uniref:RNA-binding region-containing protein 3-like isoform X2 n=1 Tax=Bacillus rossius redtenbacheri TaxID=93214 RepID=UPI002FDCF6EC
MNTECFVLFTLCKYPRVGVRVFENEEAAKAALFRLHQMDVLGYPLIAEFALGLQGRSFSSDAKQLIQPTKKETESKHKNYKAFLHRLNTWSAPVNLGQPPPPHLGYQYPPPTQLVLFNISCALASVPRLYTQVLHLMNRMSLPCPFEGEVFPKVAVPKDALPPQPAPEPALALIPREESPPRQDTATEESELESDGEGNKRPEDIIPEKRALPQKKMRVKRPRLSQLAAAPAVPRAAKSVLRPEEVFEREDAAPTQRRIELKLAPEPSLERHAESTSGVAESAGGFGLMFPASKAPAPEEEKDSEERVTEDDDDCITAEKLAENRISSRDQKHLPVFKNYQPGVPSCRLYIKNLARQVDERDLHFIFRRYRVSNVLEEQGSMFDIRLMKEGRMKGQAFVTLQSVKMAEKALEETNGYILKNKPMVVQFARSAKAK